jgi:sec-independent protein translocase protein TatC
VAESQMSFLEHLQDLRKRLIIAIVALIIGTAVGWPLAPTVQRFLTRPLNEPAVLQQWQHSFSSWVSRAHPDLARRLGVEPKPLKVTPHKLYYMAPLEGFFVQMKLSLVTGLVLSLPVILYQLWLFLAPALYAHEKRYVYLFIPTGTVAFILGGLFFSYMVWPLIIAFSLAYESEILSSMLNLTHFVNFGLRLMLLFGLIFEMPLILLVLARVGLVKLDFLVRQRKLAILLSMVVAAFHADLFTMTAIAIPIYLMYELSILAIRLFGGARSRTAPSAPETALQAPGAIDMD